jgi:hypothetical protein
MGDIQILFVCFMLVLLLSGVNKFVMITSLATTRTSVLVNDSLFFE